MCELGQHSSQCIKECFSAGVSAIKKDAVVHDHQIQILTKKSQHSLVQPFVLRELEQHIQGLQ